MDDLYCTHDGCTNLAASESPIGVSGPAKVGDHAEDGWIYVELVCVLHA